jgi:hypothetical protein
MLSNSFDRALEEAELVALLAESPGFSASEREQFLQLCSPPAANRE